MESIFSVYRRREKENYSFEKLHVLSFGAFNKTVEWIQKHKNRDEIIAKVGFQKIIEKILRILEFLKPNKNFSNLKTVKNEMQIEKNRILESKRPLMEIN